MTFIKAYRALGKFHGASAFRTWLTRIGLNHCRDILRVKKSWRFLSLESLIEEGRLVLEVQAEPETPEPLPALTPKMLEALSEGERRVLMLLKERGGRISYEDMARELGLSLDGVKGRLKRARAKLHQRLVEQGKRN
jgi:RNA polymerase sigma-70 factor (ECF subfamily)